MSRIKTIKMLGMILAVMLIVIGILPIIKGEVLTNDSIATSIILILLGIAYLIISFRPQWTKAVFFFEGIVIGVVGYMILDIPYNYGFAIIGLFIVAIAVLVFCTYVIVADGLPERGLICHVVLVRVGAVTWTAYDICAVEGKHQSYTSLDSSSSTLVMNFSARMMVSSSQSPPRNTSKPSSA